ncbi:MAG: SulP family inorganic anion transporter, partial [Cyanobacteria bacterium J06553_1]
LMPYTVISGFMSGIGLIIILTQIGPFLGQSGSASVVQSVKMYPEFVANANSSALGLGILTLAIVFGCPRKISRLIPSPLLALIIGTIAAITIGHYNPENGLLLIGDIPSQLPEIQFPSLKANEYRAIFGYGLMLAVLGSIDSLLTSLVADNITQSQHDSDRELIGQGIGNFISGLFGGLPGAGATMRTVINVKSGGKTPVSGMVHALVLLFVVLKAGPLTANIPHAVLAGILIKVGIDIIDWSFLGRAHQISLKTTGLMYLVVLLTVFVDLVTAVAVGVFFANLLTVKNLSDIQSKKVKAIVDPDNEMDLNIAERHILKKARGKILLFNLTGPMSFGAAKTISQQMGIVRKYEVLILDLNDVPMIGVTASLAIENMVKDAYSNNHQVFLVGAEGKVKERLQKMKLLNLVPPENCFKERIFALQKAIAWAEMPEQVIFNPEAISPDSSSI